MRRPSSFRPAILVGLGAAAGWALMRQASWRGAPASDAPAIPEVRIAEREEIAKPPRSWDIVDEQVDESFPASDPPGPC